MTSQRPQMTPPLWTRKPRPSDPQHSPPRAMRTAMPVIMWCRLPLSLGWVGFHTCEVCHAQSHTPLPPKATPFRLGPAPTSAASALHPPCPLASQGSGHPLPVWAEHRSEDLSVRVQSRPQRPEALPVRAVTQEQHLPPGPRPLSAGLSCQSYSQPCPFLFSICACNGLSSSLYHSGLSPASKLSIRS